MTYLFETHTYMKPYNEGRYWIMSDYVNNITVEADTPADALTLYREQLDNWYGIQISKTAVKNRGQFFNHSYKPIGYIYTGKTQIVDRGNNVNVSTYIDVYVRCYAISDIMED